MDAAGQAEMRLVMANAMRQRRRVAAYVAQRKEVVCREVDPEGYAARPDAYTYTPERCVDKPGADAGRVARRARPATDPPPRAVPPAVAEDARQVQAFLDTHRNPVANATSAAPSVSGKTRERVVTERLLQRITVMPRFLVAMVDAMLAPANIQREPGVLPRYTRLAAELENGLFKNDITVRWATFNLLKSSLAQRQP